MHGGRTAAGAGRGRRDAQPTRPARSMTALATTTLQRPPPTTLKPLHPSAPLLELRDGLPTGRRDRLRHSTETVDAFAAGTGPFAIDAERASGYRYIQRAYLIQLRREGAGTALIDPLPFGRLCPRSTTPSPTPSGSSTPPARTWSVSPSSVCGRARCSTPSSPGACSTTRGWVWRCWSRSCSASGCARSTRPSTGRDARCPIPGLSYAALDVEVLVELRDVLERPARGGRQGGVGRQEFAGAWGDASRADARAVAAYVGHPPGPQSPGLAVVRAMWEARDQIAESADISPAGSDGNIICWCKTTIITHFC